MAAGKAIIASNLPVFSEVLRDGVTALLADPSDPLQWQAALRRLIDRPGERQTLARNARHEFTKHYTWQQRAQRVLHNLPLN